MWIADKLFEKEMWLTDQEYNKIIALQLLSEYLPLRFDNGSCIDGFTTCCYICKKDIMPENTRVYLELREHSVAIDGYAICYDCRMISPFKMRISDDGSMLIAREDGTWAEASYSTPKSWWYSFKDLLGNWKKLLIL